jgi:uncharacterized membrane protein YccC
VETRAAVSVCPVSDLLVLMALRTGTAVTGAGFMATAAGLQRPYWAMASAGAVLGQGTYASGAAQRGTQRVGGTMIGTLLGSCAIYARS